MKIIYIIRALFHKVFYRPAQINEYIRKLKKSFPEFLATDLEKVIEIIPMKETIYLNNEGLQYEVENGMHGEIIKIKLPTGDVTYLIDRIYFREPEKKLEDKLTTTQKLILTCIYTRHHNGYIREERLKKLNGSDDEWILPYKLQLLGEYVLEILVELDKQITDENIKQFKLLTLNNRKYWERIESRMTSYWNAYHRFPNHIKLRDYIGKKLVTRISKVNT